MSPPPERRAIVLLSGGMDSATAAALARRDGWTLHALAIDYGQRHRAELGCAGRVARALGAASFRILTVDLALLGGSALTAPLDVPKDRPPGEIGTGIPITYVPARNTVFLALALAAAETSGAAAIVLGVNALDYSGYPDCRPEFLQAFEAVARTGTRQGVDGHAPALLAPLLSLSKAQIVETGEALGVPWAETLSCYDPVAAGPAWLHCGRCDACALRARGFAQAGVADPTAYAR